MKRCPAQPKTSYGCQRMGIATACRFCGAPMDAPMLSGDRDGATFTEADRPRLDGQMLRVYEVMSDGEWHTARELESLTGDNWASVSARCRDLRKPRFGGYHVERRNDGGGVFAYRIASES